MSKITITELLLILTGFALGCEDSTDRDPKEQVGAGGTATQNGGASNVAGGPMTGGTISNAGAWANTGGAAGGAIAGGAGGVNGVAGMGNSTSAGASSCAAYDAAVLDGDLLGACRLASDDWCKGTLEEFIAAQLKTATEVQVKLVEGCSTRSVGWDARLGGKVLTYDASGNLVGFVFWDDIPNGPCKSKGGYPTAYSYRMGEGRSSLLEVSTSCASDQLCTVAASRADQVHCPVP